MSAALVADAPDLTGTHTHRNNRVPLFLFCNDVGIKDRINVGFVLLRFFFHIVNCFQLYVDIHLTRTIRGVFLHEQRAKGTLRNGWRAL